MGESSKSRCSSHLNNDRMDIQSENISHVLSQHQRRCMRWISCSIAPSVLWMRRGFFCIDVGRVNVCCLLIDFFRQRIICCNHSSGIMSSSVIVCEGLWEVLGHERTSGTFWGSRWTIWTPNLFLTFTHTQASLQSHFATSSCKPIFQRHLPTPSSNSIFKPYLLHPVMESLSSSVSEDVTIFDIVWVRTSTDGESTGPGNPDNSGGTFTVEPASPPASPSSTQVSPTLSTRMIATFVWGHFEARFTCTYNETTQSYHDFKLK